ncbi:Metallopeptidase AprA [Methylobacterium bullatum]|uniref:Metallopeptidase AprA n=1 Tax=Methylobacterium bullatum TaxID=570505 RepID=A0A679IWA3_9HYPH|nr:Metallopeptidase AprA [Methylobacterium bullatum]
MASVVSIVAAEPVLNATSNTTEVTFTFSEAVIGFDSDDVVIPNNAGTMGDLTGNGTVWKGVFTANPGFDGQITLSITDNYENENDDAGEAGGSLQLTIDTAAPTVTVNLASTTFSNTNSDSQVTFTLSEASDDFDKGDVTVTGGRIDNLTASADGLTYTGTFTAEEDSTAPVTILVDAGAFTDAAGNANTPSNLDTATVDTVAPTVVSIVADETSLNATSRTTEVTFTFSEAVTGFVAGDVDISGAGSLDTLSTTDDGLTWTGTFTAPVGLTGSTTLSVLGAYADAATNAGSTGGSETLTFDTEVPAVLSITAADTDLNMTDASERVTFTFSEAVTNFTASDVTITNDAGTMGNVSSGDGGTTWTGTFFSNGDFSGSTTLSVTGDYADSATNLGEDGGSLTLDIDRVAPTVSLIEVVASDLNVTSNTTEVTFTFSEAVTGFTASDVAIANDAGEIGTLTGSNGGKTWTGTFTAAEGFAGSTTLSVTGEYTDLASNPGSEGYTQTLSIDTRAPTVLIDLDRDAFNIGNGTATVTFTLSEPSPNFDKADVTVIGGSIDGLTASADGLTYTGTVTAEESFTGELSVSVAAGAFVDYSGNANAASTPDTATVDTVASTVSVYMPAYTFNIISPTSEVTFTLGEASDNFDKSDVTVTGGSIGDLTASDDGLTYTGTFTAEEDSTTPVSISVGAGAFTDAAGNGNIASNTDGATVDTVAPTVEINILAATLNVNVPDVTVTFTLSEASTNFDRTDVTVTGGSIGDLTKNGDGTYTGTVTADEGFTGELSVSVAAERFNDAAANGNAASLVDTATVDMVAPTVTVDLAADSFNIDNPTSTATFTLSEASTDFPGSDFDASDVTVVGGVIGDLTKNGDGTYTGIVTADEDSTTLLSVSVAAGAFGDMAGNSNTASNLDTATVDTVAPTVVSIVAADTDLNSTSNSTLVTFTFSEAVTGFAKDDVLVTGPGLLGDLETTNGGLTWTGTFTASAGQTGSATLAVSGAYLDASSNPGAVGGLETLTIDTRAPMVTVNLVSTAFSDTNPTSEVTFALTEAVIGFDKSDVTVAGGSIGDLTASDDGMTYTGTVTANPNSTTPVSVSVGLGRFTDAAGNANLGSAPDTATVDRVAPTVTSIVAVDSDLNVNDTSEIVTFTFSEAVTGFTASDVTITGLGSLGTVSSTNGGTIWTGNFIAPGGMVSSTTLSVTGDYFDSASNLGLDGGSETLSIDTQAPTVTVDLVSEAFSDNAATSAVTITLSEISAGFDKTAVTVNGGTLSDLTASLDGLTYTGIVTADQNSTEPVSIYVSTGAFTDVAGNANAPSMSDNATVDTVNPTVALLTISDDTGASGSDLLTRDRSLSVSGTVEAGSTVTVAVLDLGGNPVLVNGAPVTLVATVTGGTFTTASTPSLLDGSYIFRATATDGVGNTTTSDLSPVRVDNTTALPTFALATASDTGVSATDLLTKHTTPAFTGTAEVGATVQLFLDGSEIGTAVVDLNGSYTLAFADSDLNGTPLTDGSYTLTALVTDLAGNTKLSPTVKTFTVDATAPTATVVIVDGSFSDGNLTSKVTFSFTEAVDPASLIVNATGGSIEPGSLVVADDGLSATATFIATDNSTTDATVTLAAFKDLAGNAGTSTASTAVPVDTVNPTVGIAFDKISFNDGNLTSTVTFSFSEAVDTDSLDAIATGGTIDMETLVFTNGGRTATATFTADEDSTTDATVTLTAFKDLVGNAGTSTPSAPVPVDTLNPTVGIAFDEASLSDGTPSSTVTFTFSEAVDAGSLDVSATGGTIDMETLVFTDGGLTAKATFTATEGSTTDAKVTLTAFKDLVGNAGASTASDPVAVDTVNPTVISITAADQSLNVAGNTTTVTFTFSEAVEGFEASDVAYDTSTGTLGALTSDDNITWTGEFTAKLGITGTATLSIGGNGADYTDLVGNTGVQGGSLSLTIDTAPPTIGGFTISTDNGQSGTDKITRDNTLSVSGSVSGVASGTDVHVAVMDGDELVTTLTGGVLNGSFTTNVSPILASPGALGRNYTFVASVMDANGNITTESFNATIDRATTVATIGLASGSDQGVPGDGITSNATPDFFGTAEAGATVDVFLDGELLGTAVANESGQFLVSFAESGLDPLSNGTYTLTTSSTDIAGNTKQDTVGTTFTIDRTAPTATITLSDTSLVVGETATVTITFSEAVAGFGLEDLVSGNGVLSALTGPTAGQNGSVVYTATLTPTANSEDSTNVVTLSTQYTDVAGNTGTTASTGNFTVDTLAPTVLTVSVSGAGITDGSGTLVTGQIVSFTLAMSEAVIVSNGGALVLTLSNGTTALYSQEKSTGTSLVFDYTVLVDQISSDLAITGVSLNGASIADVSGNPFDISGTAVNPAGTLTIDGYTGTSGSETFRGTTGAETFTGLGGADTYIIDNIGDLVIESPGGDTDTVRTSVNFTLGAGQGIEVLRGFGIVGLALTGNEFDNRIVGTSGNDVIDGKAGIDALFGNLGDDTYFVDNAGDQVTEAAQAGNDTVQASVSYTLKAGQEIETLEGSGSTGLTLTGNNFANRIVGTEGNDILDGKTGADTLSGGAGNDSYYVDNVNDHVIETTGTDTVYASVSYALESGVEIEALRAFGSNALTLTGNEFANTIVGGAAKDVIVGGLGQDTLVGGAGNDTFVFKTVSDSGTGTANRDAILDFKVGFDHIDLSVIQAVSGAATDQSFSFIEGAFTKHKGELHAVASGISTIIEGDVDGNGKADFQIVLRGTIEALHANDFIL